MWFFAFHLLEVAQDLLDLFLACICRFRDLGNARVRLVILFGELRNGQSGRGLGNSEIQSTSAFLRLL